MVAGGSRGLGKSLAIELAKRGVCSHAFIAIVCGTDVSGAHILLLARGQDTLEVAKAEVSSYRKSSSQMIEALSTDLCDPLAVSPPDVHSMNVLTHSVLVCTY